MAQEIPIIRLRSGKGKPTVDTVFGHAHLGTYRMFRWDSAGKNPELLAHGNNIDEFPDEFEVGPDLASLDGAILSYEVVVQAAEPKEGSLYTVTITVRQAGEVCDGGLIQESGTFKDVKSIIGFRRFKI